MPSCPACRSSNPSLAERCARCGEPLVGAEPSPSDSLLEAELLRPRRVRRNVALAVLVTVLVAGVAAGGAYGWFGRGGASPSAADGPARGSAAPAVVRWEPAPGPRQDLIAVAQAFPSLDERSLGALFDARLRPLYGAPNLFVAPKLRRVPRHDMRHSFEQLTDETQLDLGFREMLKGLGASWSATSSYQLYRALQVNEIITLDESQAMQRPPDEAMFYLAEVRTGASYDMFVRAMRAERGASAELYGLSLEELTSSGHYQVTHRGAGLSPTTGSAVFARTPEEVARAYASSGTPVAVELVFRTLPTRSFARKQLPRPRVLIDAAVELGEGEARYYTLAPGAVALRINSVPKGVVLRWDQPVQCSEPAEGPERTSFEAECSISRRTVLTVMNYTQQGKGPIERAKIYLARLPLLP